MALTKIPAHLSSTPSISDSGSSTAITIDSSGNVAIAGNLSVTGSTTTADNLTSADKNITLNYHASNDTSGSADGAGITIQDAVDASNNASLTWNASGDKFVFSHLLNAPRFIQTSSVESSFYSGTFSRSGSGTAADVYGGNGTLALGYDASNTRLVIANNPYFTGGNVGIGTSSPIAPLHVSGNAVIETGSPDLYLATTSASHTNWRIAAQEVVNQGFEIASGTTSAGSNAVADTYTTRLTIKNDGKVGIGTTNPSGKLDIHTVDTSAYSSTGEPVETVLFHNESGSDGTGSTYYSSLGMTVGSGATSQGFINYVRTADNQGRFAFSQRTGSSSYAEAMTILNDGKVGIGTTSPDEKLHVEGSVLIDAFNAGDETGIFFREGFSSTNKYNVSILAKDHNGSSADGISINGYDGISFCTGSNTRQQRMLVTSSGGTASDPLLSMTAAHPWIDMVAPDGGTWKSGITMRGGSSSTQAQVHFHMTRDSGYKKLSTAGDYDAYISTTTANAAAYGDLVFGTDDTESFRISAADQHVLIGREASVNDSNGVGNPPLQIEDATPGIHLYGTNTSNYAHSGGISFGSAESGGDNSWFYIYSHDENFHIYNNNSRAAYFPQGTTATWQYGSDERLKENIVDLNLGLNTVNSLKPRRFNWKQDGLEDIGFIAQEVKDHIPVAIAGTGESWVDGEDQAVKEAKTLKIANDKLIPVLVKAVQELSAKLEAAEARITELEG